MATASTDCITLTINGKHVTVRNPDPSMYLTDFLRDHVDLKGTKLMCREGACGACKVVVSKEDPCVKPESIMAVNSCLVPLMSLNGWFVTTIEKLGSDRAGLSKLQTNMVEKFGMQCGYCTPGMIMNGFSCLVKHADQMAKDPRELFDGNICRCTGYRPIMDAMKCSAEVLSLKDIEDICRITDGKRGKHDLEVDLKGVKRSCSKWIQPQSIKELLSVLKHSQGQSVHIMAGNTSMGIYKKKIDAELIVNVQDVAAMRRIEETVENMSFGAAVTLTEMATRLEKHASMLSIAKHIRKVGSEGIRNVGTWAGNLMLIHSHRDFPSDIFILLVLANAVITIVDFEGNAIECDCWEFLKITMENKVITSLKVDKIFPEEHVKTFKVMPRHQGSYAYVHAAFRADVDKQKKTFNKRPMLLFGALGTEPIRATRTEMYLENLKDTHDPLGSNATLQACLKLLSEEVRPVPTMTGPSVKYRKEVALNLFYKFYLSLVEDSITKENRNAIDENVEYLVFSEQSFPSREKKYPMTKPIHRLDSDLMVCGKTEYTNDIPCFKNEVFAAIVLAGAAPATFDGLDTKIAESMPGFIDVFTYKDIPGSNRIAMADWDAAYEQVLCDGPVHYAGQAVAVVVADSQVHADEIANHVKVILKGKGKPVLDLKSAIEKELFHPDKLNPIVVGDTAGAMTNCAKVINGQLETKSMHHFYIEPQTCVVVPREKEYEVYSATQAATRVQTGVAEILGIQSHKVFVTNQKCGGGFGGKNRSSIHVAAMVAIAAYSLERPVRIACNYNTNMKMTGNRAPFLANYKVGLDSEGMLQAIELDIFVDAGHEDRNVDIFCIKPYIDNAYYCPNWTVHARECRTNTATNTHLRGPGSSQSKFIIESIMEHVAWILGESPEIVRERNLYKIGQITNPLHTEPVDSGRLENTWNDLVMKCNFINRKAKVEEFNKKHRWRKRGISLLPWLYRHGYYNFHFSAAMSVFYSDASVVVYHGGTEMGQGINTRICQLAATRLDIPLDLVSIGSISTRTAANNSESGGSVTSEQVGRAVIRCCEILNERLEPIRSESPNLTWNELIMECKKKRVDLSVSHLYSDSEKHEYLYYNYAAVCSEAEVDILTGETTLIRTDLLFDAGESINPGIDIGQLEGAFVMAIGQFMKEKIIYNPETGDEETSGTWNYHPPLATDIPCDFRVHLQKDSVNSKNAIGSKAVGEPAMGMATSCVLAAQNAVSAARCDVGNKDYASIDGPATIDQLQQLTLWKLENLEL